MNKTNVTEYFPENYQSSRHNFLKQIEKISSPIEKGSWKVPSKVDQDLYVDYAWLAPKKSSEKLLVLITGIHGSETYTGSAVLNLFLDEILPHVNRDHLGIFIVHSMNPYGFKNHRRCTENNVNLNRNFSADGELFKIKNADSLAMNALIQNRKPVTSLKSKLLENLRRENNTLYFGDVSLEQLTKGIAPGQFESAQNLEYGGTKPEPQTQAFTDAMKKLMPQFKDVLALDIHTGLGDNGRLHLLTDGQGDALNLDLFNELFNPQEDHEVYAFTPADTEGFYPVHGATNSLFGELAEPHQRVCAITLEFGTLGHSLDQQLEGFNRSLIEHQGHHYGYADQNLEKEAKRLNFIRSYPIEVEWKKKVLTAAENLLLKVLKRAKCYS